MSMKYSRKRTWIQAAAFALQNGYIKGWLHGSIATGATKKICTPGLNCYSCPGALFSCPIGALQAVLSNASFRFSLYVFGFLGLTGTLFGRLVCGFLCPFGFLQDLLYKIPLFKKKKGLPLPRRFRFLRYLMLLLVLALPLLTATENGAGEPWFCAFICPAGTLLGGVPLVSFHASLREAAGLRFAVKLAVLFCILLLSVKYYRPFCGYLCPLGALYGLLQPVSVYQIHLDTEKCIRCGACQTACGMDIRVWEQPNSPDCIRCLKCVHACPTDALSAGFRPIGKPVQPRAEKTAPACRLRIPAAILALLPLLFSLRPFLSVLYGVCSGAYADGLLFLRDGAPYCFSAAVGVLYCFFALQLIRKRGNPRKAGLSCLIFTFGGLLLSGLAELLLCALIQSGAGAVDVFLAFVKDMWPVFAAAGAAGGLCLLP